METDRDANRAGEEYASRRPLHETAPGLADAADTVNPAGSNEGAGNVAETGTTVVGLVAGDAAVLGADQRASVGGGRFVTNKGVRKVEPVHPTGAAALSGTVGHLQQFVRVLRAESRLYAERRDGPPSMSALGTLAASVLRTSGMQVSPLLGGVDADGAHVLELDGGGGVLSDTYAAGGSGMQLAYGVLENEYADDIGLTEAREVAAAAVEHASERDTASGNGVTLATVTVDGVDIDEYAAAEEVA
ncbi:Ntn hydrolase family protein [Halocalculus aciditolerans]|uniref:proteasome endopeptidase complex n=1 Tax=Halocalculus aciditolerans TaxID=1383812 RepID=A0A830F8Z3_9EURY|nr:proteasome subunit beta [Halocalculus aciditolerans]GGL51655.1 proteasome subunit beta [Halocalculus aciditolerans]